MNNPRRNLLGVVLAVGLTLVALPGQVLAGDVPFSGRDSGHFDIPAACDDGVLVVIVGSGKATHLGRYTYSSHECFNPATGAFAGSATITAANGDTILGTYAGQVFGTDDPDVIGYEEELTITGGNGRFAGATGELHVVGWANLVTGAYGQELTGAISSPGSADE